MTLKLNPFTAITVLDPAFMMAINNTLRDTPEDTSGGVILNFVPKSNPKEYYQLDIVELSIDSTGDLQYFSITPAHDSSLSCKYVWDFIEETFTQRDEAADLVVGRAPLHIMARKLAALVGANGYEVNVTPLFDHSGSIQST